jgi:hypothetical protein
MGVSLGVVPKIPAGTVVPMTMFRLVGVPCRLQIALDYELRATMTAPDTLPPRCRWSLCRWPERGRSICRFVAIVAVLARVLAVMPTSAAEEAFLVIPDVSSEAGADDVGIPTLDGNARDPAVATADPLADELPAPSRLLSPGESTLPSAELLDVSARAVDGMRIEEFAVDEMPFEASSGRWFWNGGWYVSGEAVWLDRSRNNRQVIAIDQPGLITPRPPLVYTTSAQPFDVAPGARILIGRALGRDYLDRDQYLEFLWYGGFQWEDDDGWNATQPDGSFVTPLNPFAPGFNGSTRYTTQTNTDFNSWEFNYRLRRRLGRDKLVMSPNGDWTKHAERGWLPGLIVGARVAHINDIFAMQSSIPQIPDETFGGSYRVAASSVLLGLNLGAELISQNEFYYWGLRGRAAPCVSFAEQSQTASGTTPGPDGEQFNFRLDDRGSQNFAGFLGDLSLLAGWNITPNLSVQAGWEFLWAAGIATAPRQFDLDNSELNYIDAGGQMFFMGASLGMTASW